MTTELETNPWKDIWLNPRRTIAQIVKFNPRHRFVFLSAIYGLPMVLNIAQNYSMAETIPLWAIVISALVLCTFIGALGISVMSWLFHVTGRWIGGQAKYLELRAAVSWSNVPNVLTIAMWFLMLGVFGDGVFHRAFVDSVFVGYQAGIVFLVFLIESIASVWGLVILFTGVSEVQRFSVWKAILNVLIPFILLIAIIWGLGLIMTQFNTQ